MLTINFYSFNRLFFIKKVQILPSILTALLATAILKIFLVRCPKIFLLIFIYTAYSALIFPLKNGDFLKQHGFKHFQYKFLCKKKAFFKKTLSYDYF